MIPKKVKKILKKQHYEIVGDHSAVQVCRWTKKSLRDEGECYKSKFYGISSWRCVQMSPWLACQNSCLHCWRAIELDLNKCIKGEIDSPSEIIGGCIKAQRKLLQGFKILPETKHKTVSKTNMKKWQEAQEPTQFAVSLMGEGILYSKIGELISELRKRGKTSFLVTNGLYPEKIKELSKKKQLPTQLYVSVNAPNEKLFKKISRSSKKDAWKKLNETLELMKDLKCRTVFRMNLIKDLNMVEPENYAKLIKKSKCDFIEIKGFMSVGFARQRLGYDKMPTNKEMEDFIKLLLKELKGYKLLDKHEFSRAYVLGKRKGDLKIRKI